MKHLKMYCQKIMYFVSLFLIKTCVSNTCSLKTVTELRFKSSRVKTIKNYSFMKIAFPGFFGSYHEAH